MRGLTVFVLGSLLAACGGGGGSSTPAAPAPPMNPPTFQVQTIAPADQQQLNAFPNEIVVTFSADVDANGLNDNSVSVIQSGGDNDFSNGNETAVNWNGIVVNGAVATIDFTGTNLNDDTYQVTLRGSGADVVSDTDANTLDGDADGNAGGDFISTFSVMAAAPVGATLTSIQDSVFTMSCAFAGCHGGANPAAGMNLSDGMTFANVAGIASSQMPALQRVNPGNADDSYLVRKIEGAPGIVGVRMPAGGAPPLSNALIQDIREWIDNGALDN